MTLPQPEIYRDYELLPQFDYKDRDGVYLGKSDWIIVAAGADTGYMRRQMTLSEVKESIDDLLNQ